jgi:hypothetical protein
MGLVIQLDYQNRHEGAVADNDEIHALHSDSVEAPLEYRCAGLYGHQVSEADLNQDVRAPRDTAGKNSEEAPL